MSLIEEWLRVQGKRVVQEYRCKMDSIMMLWWRLIIGPTNHLIVRCLCHLVKDMRFKFLFFMETKSQGNRISFLRTKLRYDNMFVVDMEEANLEI